MSNKGQEDELNLFPSDGVIPFIGEKAIRTGLRERRRREAKEAEEAAKAQMVARARQASKIQKRRRIARKKAAKDFALGALEVALLAAAAWFAFSVAARAEEDIIKERGGNPNVGFYGEYVGDPAYAPEEYYVPGNYYVPEDQIEDSSSRGR